jgi:Copper transport outer membrane protein, MctB
VISFRYHIVSIVAVFLALALGIIVGAGAVLDDLHKQVSTLKGENGRLRAGNESLQNQANNADRFASAYGAGILKGTLTNRTVAIVSAPAADGSIARGVAKDVEEAGATVTTRVAIEPAYGDPSNAENLVNFVTKGSVHPPNLQLPDSGDAPALTAALLSYEIAGKDANPAGLTTVMSGLARLKAVAVTGTPKPAQLIIVVTSGTAKANSPQQQAMLTLLTRFSTDALPTMVAGDLPSAQPDGLVAIVRGDDVAQLVSTVDNADTALGQVSSTLALAELSKGAHGHYGTGPGAKALFPPQT